MAGSSSSPPTIQEVANLAGVALSSASRVLNNHPDVSTAMREKVMEAVTRLGYRPDLVAQGLRRGSTNTVGFVVRDITNPVFADIVTGAEAVLWKSGYSVLLANSGGDPDLESAHVKILQQRRVEGLILSLESESHAETLRTLHSTSAALVLLDRDVSGIVCSAVLSDHYPGIRAALAHLVSLGHTRIGFISGPPTIRTSRERLRGYIDAHEAAGIKPSPHLQRLGSFAQEFGYQQADELLALKDSPTAIVAAGLQQASGALSAIRNRRLKLGRDVSFVTCDSSPLLDLFTPPISVVARDTTKMGQVAAQLMLNVLRNNEAPEIVHLPTEYVARASVGTASPKAHR